MSSKNHPVKRTPRAMPVETIITRFKSAQQKKPQEPEKKKQKRDNKKNKDTKKDVLQVGRKTSIKEIKQLIENNEFCPNRHKRIINRKKIVLIPKHCLKIVGGTKSSNKRKLHIPRKEQTSQLSSNESSQTSGTDQNADISLPELIRIIEESGSLDDEDFLEILTCPSPVWWEDPPHGYMEEALYSRSPPINESDKSHTQTEEIKSNNTDNLEKELIINVDNRSKNFIKKRGKLETLLNNIRDKVNNANNNTNNNTFAGLAGTNKDGAIFSAAKRQKTSSDSFDDDVLTHLENINIPVENESNNGRKPSTDYDSDKNMSIVEEYLDMSYFEDEDLRETKIDLNDDAKESTERFFGRFQRETDECEENQTGCNDNESTEYVAVYKIISSDDEIENADREIKSKNINSYYKQKKFRSSKSECLCHRNKSIRVSDTESIKYCLVCSSINDTDDCKYCLGKPWGKCTCKGQFTCDVCNMRTDSKHKIIRHLKTHNNDGNN